MEQLLEFSNNASLFCMQNLYTQKASHEQYETFCAVYYILVLRQQLKSDNA